MKSASAALITAVALLLSAACSNCHKPTGPPVAVPSKSATPVAVVRAYLKAAIARDEDTVRTLTTPKYWKDETSAPDGPLNNWISVEDLRVSEPIPDTYQGETYRQVKRVVIDFTLRQCEPFTFHDGSNVGSFLLVRNKDSERWRIASGGLG